MSLKIDTYSAKTSKVMECGIGFVFTKHGFKIGLKKRHIFEIFYIAYIEYMHILSREA